MNQYRDMRFTNNEKIEAIKNKLNASNIIRKDLLNQSYLNRNEPRNVYTNYKPMNLNTTSGLTNQRYDDLKERVQKEINIRVNLQTEKRELELMIEDQKEAQEKLKEEYSRHIDSTKGQIEHLNQMIEDLQKDLENKMDKKSKMEEENTEIENEINELLDENKLLEQEIEKLGQKTNQKMNEMQSKMENGLQDLEKLKLKHDDELSKLDELSREKIKRIEDDYNKKISDMNDRYNDMLLQKQDTEAEFLRLQDAKKRAEFELENKIKAIKEQYYEDEYNKFRGILKIYNNRLRNAIDNKENLMKKQDKLQKDLEMMEDDTKTNEMVLDEENQALNEAITALKDDIETIKRETDQKRTDNYTNDSKMQKLQSEIQRNKFNFKQISENGKYKIKEVIEKNKHELEHMNSKLNNQGLKVRDLEEELKQLDMGFKNAEKQNQRLLGNMRNQLNKNIYQTINEYKDFNNSRIGDQNKEFKEKSFHNSYYLK